MKPVKLITDNDAIRSRCKLGCVQSFVAILITTGIIIFARLLLSALDFPSILILAFVPMEAAVLVISGRKISIYAGILARNKFSSNLSIPIHDYLGLPGIIQSMDYAAYLNVTQSGFTQLIVMVDNTTFKYTVSFDNSSDESVYSDGLLFHKVEEDSIKVDYALCQPIACGL